MGQGEPRGKRQGNDSKHKEPLAVWRFVGLCVLFWIYLNGPLAVWRFVGLCVLFVMFRMCVGQGEPRGKRQGNASKHKEPLAVWRFVGLCILFGIYRLFVGQGC